MSIITNILQGMFLYYVSLDLSTTVIFDCVKALPPKNKSPKIVFTLLSQSLKRTEGIKCKQISQQRVDMQMRNVTNFPEHVHRSFPQEEEYFANTVSQPRDPSHWIRR